MVKYFADKKLTRLLWGITLKHNDDYYCINRLHLFRTESKPISHESVCKNHGYCHVKIPEEYKKILKYNHD